MKQVYEVFRHGTFIAVVKPGSYASNQLFNLGYYKGDVLVEVPLSEERVYYNQEIDICRRVRLIDQVR